MDLLPSLSAFTVFLGIAGIGFIFLIISMVFGEIFDFFDHDIDFDHGGPGILSSRVIAVFITAFGAFGAIARQQRDVRRCGFTASVPAAASSSAASSTCSCGSSSGSRPPRTCSPSDLVGQTGRVIIGIPANGVGQVRVPHRRRARRQGRAVAGWARHRRAHLGEGRDSARRNGHCQQNSREPRFIP